MIAFARIEGTMQHLHRSSGIDLARIRLALGLLNVAFVALAAALCYAVYLALGTFPYAPLLALAAWCTYVQFAIRSRVRSARALARASLLQNLAWGLFGTYVILSQFALPVVYFLKAN